MTPTPGIPPPESPPVPVPSDGRARLPAPRTPVSPTLDPEAVRAPESRMLPPHMSKAERIGDHLAALSADLREWTELRIALVQRKVEGVVGIVERVEHLKPVIALYVAAGVLAVIGALFVLVTLAIGIGALLNAYWAGFAIVTFLLLFVAAVLVVIAKRKQTAIDARLAAEKRAARSARNRDPDDVQAAQRASVRQAVS